MSESKARDLDLFLLSMISSGLSTSYELKLRACISLGTTLPVLARLSRNGLIKADDPGPRRSRRFKVTKAGVKMLNTEWKGILNQPATNPDEIFRIAYLALSQGGVDVALSFIARAAQGLSARAIARAAEANAVRHELVGSEDPGWYSSLKLRSEAAASAAQAQLLRDLAVEMKSPKRRKKRS